MLCAVEQGCQTNSETSISDSYLVIRATFESTTCQDAISDKNITFLYIKMLNNTNNVISCISRLANHSSNTSLGRNMSYKFAF